METENTAYTDNQNSESTPVHNPGQHHSADPAKEHPGVRPDVINYDDVVEMIPKLKGHRKLVNWVLHLLKMDEVNRVHGKWCYTQGAEFARHLIDDDFHIDLQVDNEEVLDRFKEGAFITVSNHPFGSIDGIMLIYIMTKRRPEFKVMVNMFLNRLSAMRPNFIAVDPQATDDPEKRRVSVNGIREALRMLKSGEPVGFFPAGAMSKTDRKGFLVDRPWQESVLQIIARAKVPVIPVYFHGNNTWFFNLMGHVCWQIRTALLPRELFKKRYQTLRVTIGDPIMPEDQLRFKGNPDALGAYLRERTYALAAIR